MRLTRKNKSARGRKFSIFLRNKDKNLIVERSEKLCYACGKKHKNIKKFCSVNCESKYLRKNK